MNDPIDTQAVDAELQALVEPFDEHNQHLLANVHPPEWRNPEPASRYHLVVIGGGTAGLVSAAGAAGLGARVAMIERRLLGGDCLNYGCVPSKAVIRAARAWQDARTAEERFGGPTVAGEGDFGQVMERMRALRAGISRHDSAQRFSDLGVDVFIGDGRFTSPDTIEVAGATLNFRRAIVATGGHPFVPPIPGCDEDSVFTNENIFSLTALPPRLGVVGAGPIGCELAQSFARFGSHVTLFDLAPQILIREDPDAAKVIEEALVRDGVELRTGVQIGKVESANGVRTVHFEQNGESFETPVDALLMAVGRAPNVEGLGLEEAGIAFNRKGIEVDDRLRTSNKKVFAVGDVASRYQFTHTADALARIAIQNSLFFGRAKASDLVIPWCTYTSPEIAHVGLYEKDAVDQGIEIDTLTLPMSDNDRAVLEGADEGFLRVHLAKGKDRILGATLVSDHAGDLLGELSLAATTGVGLGRIAGVIHAYPTQAEIIKRAGDTWRRGKLTPLVKRLFEIFLGIFK